MFEIESFAMLSKKELLIFNHIKDISIFFPLVLKELTRTTTITFKDLYSSLAWNPNNPRPIEWAHTDLAWIFKVRKPFFYGRLHGIPHITNHRNFSLKISLKSLKEIFPFMLLNSTQRNRQIAKETGFWDIFLVERIDTWIFA